VAAWVVLASLGWAARNYRVLGEPVLFSTNGGYNFWHGNNPYAAGRDINLPPTGEPRLNLLALRDERAINREGYRLGLEEIREHPARFLVLIPRRIFFLYYTDTKGVWLAFLKAPVEGPTLLERFRHGSRLPEQLAFRPYVVVMALALVGVGLADWRRPAIQLMGLLILYWTGWVAVTFGQDRYHVPLMPIFCLFAGEGARRLLHVARARRS
jgi:hypothetical protein